MVNLRKKTLLIWIVIISILTPFAVPILSYADSIERTITTDDKIKNLAVAPYKNELGLMVSATELMELFDIGYDYEGEAKLLTVTDDSIGTLVLMHKATKYCIITPDGEKITYECAPYFYAENEIPMIELGFFCDIFNLTYEYSADTNNISIYKDSASDTTANGNNVRLKTLETTFVSGNVSYSSGAPSGGLDVKIILQPSSVRADVYNSVISTGETHVLGTVHLNEGETSKAYSYDISQYYTPSYPTYSIFVEETDKKIYGYCSSFGTVRRLSYSPVDSLNNDIGSLLTLDFDSSATVNLPLDSCILTLSGNISFENENSAPNDMDVELILQTRTTKYAPAPYNTGQTYSLGTVHFEKGEKSKSYSFSVSPYYSAYSHQYYTLFYAVYDTSRTKQYGYLNSDLNISASADSPYSLAVYSDSAVLNLLSCEYADLTLPFKESYSEKFMFGDVLGDGEINLKDAVRLLRYLAKYDISLTENELLDADVVKDGIVNTKDAIRLSQYLAGWNVSLG